MSKPQGSHRNGPGRHRLGPAPFISVLENNVLEYQPNGPLPFYWTGAFQIYGHATWYPMEATLGTNLSYVFDGEPVSVYIFGTDQNHKRVTLNSNIKTQTLA